MNVSSPLHPGWGRACGGAPCTGPLSAPALAVVALGGPCLRGWRGWRAHRHRESRSAAATVGRRCSSREMEPCFFVDADNSNIDDPASWFFASELSRVASAKKCQC